MSLARLLDAGLRRRGRGAASELATAAGVSTATVSRWRAGRDLPGPEYWPAIETFFEVEPGTVAGALEPESRPGPTTSTGELGRVADALGQVATALGQVADALGRIADALERSHAPERG